jgi:hypothetical protein
VPGYPRKRQDPSDKLDYGWDWQKQPDPFLALGETITTSTWTAFTDEWVVSTDITLSDESHTETTTTVWVSDGVVGSTYRLTNHIVTSQSREKDETFEIYIEEQ